MKKKLLLFVICLCMFFMCGCQVPPQYTIEQSDDGSVTQTVYIPFYLSELISAGVVPSTALGILNDTMLKMDEFFVNKYENFITRLENDTSLTDAQKITLKSYCPSRNSMYGKNLNGITYELKFANALGYYYFNVGMNYDELIEELNKDDRKIISEFLITKKVSESKSYFGINMEYDQNVTLAEYINKYCTEMLKSNTELSDEKIATIVPSEFLYRYGTPSRRLHSNADLVRKVNGMYYHEWNVDLSNPQKEVITWNISANKNVWYGIVLGSTLLIVCVWLVVCKITEKKHKKSNQNGL